MTEYVNLASRDLACIWHPYTQMKTAPSPLPIVRGEGVYLYTEDGQRLLASVSFSSHHLDRFWCASRGRSE